MKKKYLKKFKKKRIEFVQCRKKHRKMHRLTKTKVSLIKTLKKKCVKNTKKKFKK